MGVGSSSGCVPANNKKVVVIGGSYAGRGVVYLLSKHPNVTWIDRRDCMIHKMLLRSSVSDEWISPQLIPHDRLAPNSKFICGNVKSIEFDKKKVHYTDDSNDFAVDYDYLIIASGATSSSLVEPEWDAKATSTKEGISAYFRSNVATIGKHSNILLLGGGPVGCELAGEIKAKYPTKIVTIANRSDILCSNMRVDKAGSEKIQKGLEKFGVNVLLNKVIDLSDSEQKSKFVECNPPRDIGASTGPVDLIINCVGSVPNTQFMPADLLTKSGHIKVDEFLKVDRDGVFAIGDCNNVAEPKLFATAGTKKFMFGLPLGQADVVVKNLHDNTSKYVAYTPATGGKPKVMLPLGPKNGVAVNVPSFFVGMKAKNFFYPAHWKFAKCVPPTVKE